MKTCTPGCILLFSALAVPPAYSQVPAHARDGGSFERLQSISIPPKTAAPFSATVVTEWTRLLEDGTTTTVKNHRTVARDSSGRVFEERRYLTAEGDKQTTALSALNYTDPSRHEFYACIPASHTCMVSTYYAPPTTAAPLQASVSLPNGTGSITREALGQTTIGNLEAIGSREITTINPGPNGYQRPEPTIKEFWYSPRLEVNLVTKRFEPRGGAQSFNVENINLNEPDPRLFIPPADYQIIHMNPQGVR